MTTGYFSADFRQGGAVPGIPTGVAAGDTIPTLDYIFTTGAHPWTKTVDGTNLVSYQAPGGSQIKVQFDDSYGNAGSYYMRVRATVSGQVFPSPAQETTINYVLMKKCIATSGGNLGFIYTRTDRMVLMHAGYSGNNHFTNIGTLCAGDLPVLDPADPGLCVLLGNISTSYPTAADTGNFMYASQSAMRGYSYNNKTNTLVSCPAYVQNFSPSVLGFGLTNISQYGGGIPLYRYMVATSPTQALSNNGTILRGYIPYLYTPAAYQGLVLQYGATLYGDTLSAGAATFEAIGTNHGGAAPWPCLYMNNDQEDLP